MESRWPHGRGDTGARIAAFDWGATSLGAIESWPQSLRTAVNLMLDAARPCYIAWGEQLISLFNDGYIPILGSKYPRALGQPYSELFSEIWDEYRPVVEATINGQAQSFTDQPVPLLGRDLAMSWFTFTWTPLRDDSDVIRGFFCLADETTEKVLTQQALEKAQQQALLASQERYKTLFEAIDEGFCIIELLFDDQGRPFDYRFIEANPAFERHTGLHGAMGRTVKEFAPAHEQYWFDLYGKVALTGEPIRFQNRAEQIDDRWFDVFAFRVGAPAERRVAVLFNDITAQKRTEEALLEADRRKDEFLATLAHELRNPLAPLRNGLQIARLKSWSEDGLRGTIDMMDRQMSHLVRLVDDLLDVGRISSGKLELKREQLELGAAVASAVESTRAAVEAARHEVTVEMTPERLWVLGDHDRLSQVFTNLLSNAVKYSEPGGRICVSLERHSGDAVVRISDSGIGIPAEAADKVFDLFSQVREHQGRYGGGLGIGLALVKRLVTLHGGRIEAFSPGEGKGSTFTVFLPSAEQPPSAAQTTVSPEEATRPSGKRILVADDNEDAVESLALMLRLMGQQVWTAADGQSALDQLSVAAPDIVILDIGMPVMDGITAARRIRSTPGFETVLLVALTGWGQESDRSRTSAAGFDQHLVKPVDIADLSALLQGARARM